MSRLIHEVDIYMNIYSTFNHLINFTIKAIFAQEMCYNIQCQHRNWHVIVEYVDTAEKCFMQSVGNVIIIIIMVIFKCYFSGEHIALLIKKKTNKKKQQRCEHRIGQTNGLKALCMMQINT